MSIKTDPPAALDTPPVNTMVDGLAVAAGQPEVVPIATTTITEPVNVAPPPLPDPPNTWRAGTLVYTVAGLAALCGWLLWGDFATSVKDRGLGSVYKLMLSTFKANATTISLLTGSLPPALALILGPIVGYKSDRHRGPRGRRIPFLLYGSPVAALSIIGLAFSPALGGVLHRILGIHSPGFNQLTIYWLALFWLVFDIASVMSTHLFGALINDVVPPQVMGRFWGAMRAVSLLAGVSFYYSLMGYAKTYYFPILIGIGTLFGVGFCMMSLNVREGDYPPPPPAGNRGAVGNFASGTREYFSQCFSKPYYLLVFFVLAVPAFALMPVNLFALFLAEDLHVSMDLYGKCSAYMYLISFLLSFPLGIIADKIHPLRLGMIALTLYTFVAFWAGTSVHDQRTYIIAFVASGVLSGCWLTGAASLGQRLLPKASFALYSSAAGAVNCLCQILLGCTLGPIIDAHGKNYRICYLAGGVTSLSCLLAAVVLYFWFKRLGGDKHYVAP